MGDEGMATGEKEKGRRIWETGIVETIYTQNHTESPAFFCLFHGERRMPNSLLSQGAEV